jgi:hypothetical protein
MPGADPFRVGKPIGQSIVLDRQRYPNNSVSG